MADDGGLVAFLRERLDEDAAIAQASAGAQWAAVGPSMVAVDAAWIGESKHARNRLGYVAAFEHEQDQSHAVRHDPARVLAEVDAKRRILDEHQTTIMSQYWCATCHVPGDVPGSNWCMTLRLLAVPYAQHPSYRKEWTP